MPSDAPNGPTTWRDVYRLVGDSETRIVARLDRIDSRFDTLDARIEVLERQRAIEAKRYRDVRDIASGTRGLVLLAIVIVNMIVSLYVVVTP